LAYLSEFCKDIGKCGKEFGKELGKKYGKETSSKKHDKQRRSWKLRKTRV